MVNLTRIYTRLGDAGETHLGDMSRVPKTHPRIEAYGDVDELNAQIGLTRTVEGLPERYGEWLARIQNDLFDVGADLSVPPGGERDRLRVRAEQVTWLEQACDEVNETLEPGDLLRPDAEAVALAAGRDGQVTWLEQACDEVNETLEPLRSFVLPGGTPAAAHLHVCRTVCRRAERRALAVPDANPEVVRYLNRLSDVLFILSRGANGGEEPLWQPGRFA